MSKQQVNQFFSDLGYKTSWDYSRRLGKTWIEVLNEDRKLICQIDDHATLPQIIQAFTCWSEGRKSDDDGDWECCGPRTAAMKILMAKVREVGMFATSLGAPFEHIPEPPLPRDETRYNWWKAPATPGTPSTGVQSQEPPLQYAKIIASLAFLTDEQRAGFFALLGASYCLHCGSGDNCECHWRDLK